MYYQINYNNNAIEVIVKGLWPFKKKYSVPIDSIKVIYATNTEVGFCLDIFTKDNRIELTEPRYGNCFVHVNNWDELISILKVNIPDFNWNNFDHADEVWEIPFLCWHSEKRVQDIEVVEVRQGLVVVNKDRSEYVFEDYYVMAKASKYIS